VPVYSCADVTTLVYHAAVPAVPPTPGTPGTLGGTTTVVDTPTVNNFGWAAHAISVAGFLTGEMSFSFDPSPLGIVCGVPDWFAPGGGGSGGDPLSDPSTITWGWYVHGSTAQVWENGQIMYTLPAYLSAVGMRLGIEVVGSQPVYWVAASGDAYPRYNVYLSTRRRAGPIRQLYIRAHLYASTDVVHTPIISLFDAAGTVAVAGPDYVMGSSQSALMPLFVAGGNFAVNTTMPLQPFSVTAGKTSAVAALSLSRLFVVGAGAGSAGHPVALPVPTYSAGNVMLYAFQAIGLGSSAQSGQGDAGLGLLPFAVFGGREYAAADLQLPVFRASAGGINFSDIIADAGGVSPGGTPLSGVTRTTTLGAVLGVFPTVSAATFIVVYMDSAGTVTSFGSVTPVIDAAALSSIDASSSLTSTSVLNAVMNSVIGATSIDSQSRAAGQVWVVNVETGASARYENFNFNSYAKIGGTYYGVRSDGIYELDGDTDAGTPITANVNMGRMDFGSKMLKRLESAYMSVSSYGTMQLRVTDDKGNAYTYDARRSDTAMQQQRIDVGRGLKANYMQFEIINDAGADFELAGAELMSVDSSRRIK
jgi:hypothetical protein